MNGAFETVSSATNVVGNFCHVLIFVDRSGSGQVYINGVASGAPVNVSAIATNANTTQTITIGKRSNGSTPFTERLQFLGLWKKVGWLDSHLQLAVAWERYNQLFAITPNISNPNCTIEKNSRATDSYSTKTNHNGKKHMFKLNVNTPRVEYVSSSLGGITQGLSLQPQTTNLCQYSEILSNAGSAGYWDNTLATITNTYEGDNPVGIALKNGTIKEDATGADTQKILTSVGLNVTIGKLYTYSIYAKSLHPSRQWIMLLNDQFAGGGAEYYECYFGLFGDGVIGNTHNITSTNIEKMLNGWYRCSCTFYSIDTKSVYLQVQIAEANGDVVVNGLNTATMAWYGVQFEESPCATSYVSSSAGIATRKADYLSYDIDDALNKDEGVIGLDYFQNNCNTTGSVASGSYNILSLTQ